MRFSLRCFIIAMLLIGVSTSYLGTNYRRLKTEETAIRTLEQRGVTVTRRPQASLFHAVVVEPYIASGVDGSSAAASMKSIMPLIDECRGLTELRLIGVTLTASDVKVVRRLNRLQDVDFSYCKLDSLASGELAQLGGVSSLHLTGSTHSLFDIDQTRFLDDLRVLDLSDTPLRDDHLHSHLKRCNKLQSLRLRHTEASDSLLVPISEVRSLTELDISQTGITGAGFRSVAHRCFIKTLLISKTGELGVPATHFGRPIAPGSIVPSAPSINRRISLDDISLLPQLTQLDVSGASFKVGTTTRTWPNLEWLALSGSKIDVDFIRQFGAAPKLANLGLADTSVTDGDLADVFASFPKLERLDLRGTSISPEGLQDCGNARHLKEVYGSANKLISSAKSIP